MTTIGKINEKGLVIEWSLKDFLSLTDEYYQSPEFSLGNESWCLRIYPNGYYKGSEGHIYVYLYRKYSRIPIEKQFIVGIKTTDGMLALERHLTRSFVRNLVGVSNGFCVTQWFHRSELFERKSDLLPSGALTLVCKMKDRESTEFSTDGALCEDYKKMLLDGQNHDLTLKIGDKEFRAHQDVLKARCRVFESMLNHNMTEKESGVIDIPDCDPQAMELFLIYVYCGKVETLDPTNMLGLYYIADKYDMQSLKQQCCDFIKKSLSFKNICEVIQLAVTHSDTNLLDYATGYFMDNTIDIMVTVEWQSFLNDNATVANELLLKSFRKVKYGEK